MEDLINIVESQAKSLEEEESLSIIIKNEKEFFNTYKELEVFTIQKGTNRRISFLKLLQIANDVYLPINYNSITSSTSTPDRLKHFEIFKLAHHITTNITLQSIERNFVKLFHFYLVTYNLIVKLVDFANNKVSIDIELHEIANEIAKKSLPVISTSEDMKEREKINQVLNLIETIKQLEERARNLYVYLKTIIPKHTKLKEKDTKTIINEFKRVVNQVKKNIPILRNLLKNLGLKEQESLLEKLKTIESFKTSNFTRYLNSYLKYNSVIYIIRARNEMRKFGLPLSNFIKEALSIFNIRLMEAEIEMIIPIIINAYILHKKRNRFNDQFLENLKKITSSYSEILCLILTIKPILYFLIKTQCESSEFKKIIKSQIRKRDFNLSLEIKILESIITDVSNPQRSIVEKFLGSESINILNNYYLCLKNIQEYLTHENQADTT